MNLAALPRPIRLRKAAVWTVAAALAFAGCEERVAGTSVGTGNPTEITLGFRDSSGAPVPVTGTLKVYAATQIPVQGFAPDPLVSMDVAGATSASLKADVFQALADSLWPKGSVENEVRRFNLVLIGRKEGFVLSGFGFTQAERAFVARAEDDKAAWTGGKATIAGVVSPLDTLQGDVDTASFNAKWDYHLFVFGTGFASRIEKGRYILAGVPRQSYRGEIILLPSKNSSEPRTDSANIFDLNGTIGSASDSLTIGPIRETVPVPDSLPH